MIVLTLPCSGRREHLISLYLCFLLIDLLSGIGFALRIPSKGFFPSAWESIAQGSEQVHPG